MLSIQVRDWLTTAIKMYTDQKLNIVFVSNNNQPPINHGNIMCVCLNAI